MTGRPWRPIDVPSLAGRTALVTGANRGIGLEVSRALADAGALVVLGCRDADQAALAAADIGRPGRGPVPEVLTLDLADLDSVADAAARFQRRHRRLDVLVNNAAVLAPPRTVTKQGIEQQFGVNHLGHFALTLGLLPAILSTPGARVVTMSSHAHQPARLDVSDLQASRGYSAWRSYGMSKLANLLFTLELQRRFERAGAAASSLAAQPGAVKTDLGSVNPGGVLNSVVHHVRPLNAALFGKPPSIGAWAPLRAATDPVLTGGEYLGPRGLIGARGRDPVICQPSSRAVAVDAARDLWEVSIDLAQVAAPQGYE